MTQQIAISSSPTSGSNPWIDSLTWGGAWSSGSGTTTIDFAAVYGYDPYGVLAGSSGQQWTQAEFDALTSAGYQWEAVADIQFNHVSAAEADVWVWLDANMSSGTLGWSEVPYYNSGSPLYMAYNPNHASWSSSGLQPGGYGYVTLIHEIGHFLGLAHPHDGGTAPGGTNFPGVSSSYGDYGTYDLNQGIFTTMSYNDGWATEITSGSNSYGWQVGPMALDIAAVQNIYGANNNWQTGNNTYYLPDSNSSGTYWQCIWDAGGTDTISNLNSSIAATINLNWAPLTGENAGGYVSSASNIVGGFTIANGALIENAVGGSGADTLIGNYASNMLSGGSGNDYLEGGLGRDLLTGGSGADTFSVHYLETSYDLITDFNVGTDIFEVGRSAFSGVLALGNLSSLSFVNGSSATADYCQFLYDSSTGLLLFDPDGSGSQLAQVCAEFSVGTTLSATDINIVVGVTPSSSQDALFTTSELSSLDTADYMAYLKDYDGNNFGAQSSWVFQGLIDVQSDGDLEYIYTNAALGRWGTLGPNSSSVVNFDNHGSGGDTRVVGIYIDPLVTLGIVEAGGDHDSQRRFQNDLYIANLVVLGGDDYDSDGFQEVYWKTVDGTAYLRSIMHADGNIQYANYQSEEQMIDYLSGQGVDSSEWSSWI